MQEVKKIKGRNIKMKITAVLQSDDKQQQQKRFDRLCSPRQTTLWSQMICSFNLCVGTAS